MADCSKCKKKRAEAAPNVNLTEDEKKIIYAMEMSGARQHQTIVKLVVWIVSIFAAALVAAGAFFNYYLVKMNAQFTKAWSEYEYVSEEVDVDGGLDGIANYIGGRGVIVNGENNSTQANQTP